MKRSCRAALSTAAALLLSIAAASGADNAGAAPATGSRPGPPPLEYFVRTLGVTTQQQPALKAVLDAARAKADVDNKLASAPSQQRPGADEMSATIRMREADLREGLARVLTPEQLAKYDQLNPKGPPPGQPGEVRDPHGHHETMTPSTAK